MGESLIIPKFADKVKQYETLYPQILALLEGETNAIARYSNFIAILKETFQFFWIGFYFVDSPEELVLGPFQGPLACMRIRYGRGVCGTAWKERKTMIVPDVNLFSGHIACNALSKSEIVVPIYSQDKNILGVLDIDSQEFSSFDSIDAEWLEKMLSIVTIR